MHEPAELPPNWEVASSLKARVRQYAERDSSGIGFMIGGILLGFVVVISVGFALEGYGFEGPDLEGITGLSRGLIPLIVIGCGLAWVAGYLIALVLTGLLVEAVIFGIWSASAPHYRYKFPNRWGADSWLRRFGDYVDEVEVDGRDPCAVVVSVRYRTEAPPKGMLNG